MRLDKVAHNADVQFFFNQSSRSGRHWMKDTALTLGGLSNHELRTKKSADAKVIHGIRAGIESQRSHEIDEKLNIKQRLCLLDSLTSGSHW